MRPTRSPRILPLVLQCLLSGQTTKGPLISNFINNSITLRNLLVIPGRTMYHSNASGMLQSRCGLPHTDHAARREKHMSLVVDRIKCVEETDGLGSDEIYMVVFRGRTSAPFSTGLASVGPGSAWDDFDSGERSKTDVTVAQ